MIRIGVCSSIDNISKVQNAGFDYLEGNLGAIYSMTDGEYEHACNIVDASTIKVEATNCMLLSHVKVTGPEVDKEQLREYLEKAFSRATRLGVKVCVFGSSGARRVPDGFNTAEGWRQVAEFLRMADGIAEKYGVTIAIEPLCFVESNIMNYVSEATLMASLLNLPHVCVLGDTYHMAMGNESWNAFRMSGSLLKHVHVACANGRACPRNGDGENYNELFKILTEIGYEGRVSIEANFENFDREIPVGFTVLDEARRSYFNNLNHRNGN